MNKPAPTISIIIADDHTLVRQAWGQLLNKEGHFKVVAECSNGEEAVQQAIQLKPDIIIMDINLPGISGIEATKQIVKNNPLSKILAASQHTHYAYAKRMISAGARGYITKTSGIEEMITALFEIMKGGIYICREIKDNLGESLFEKEEIGTQEKMLTEREKEIVDYIIRGGSSKDIGKKLNISQKTVEVHRYNILKKLQLKNSVELINYIYKNPLVIESDGLLFQV